jgi:hypothetical protein
MQVVMGDDTWMQLAKDVFAEAHPYPSFDVHDLHTVDDGVWEVSPCCNTRHDVTEAANYVNAHMMQQMQCSPDMT